MSTDWITQVHQDEAKAKQFVLENFGVDAKYSSAKIGHGFAIETSVWDKGFECRIDFSPHPKVLSIHIKSETCPYLCCKKTPVNSDHQRYGVLHQCENRHEWFVNYE